MTLAGRAAGVGRGRFEGSSGGDGWVVTCGRLEYASGGLLGA